MKKQMKGAAKIGLLGSLVLTGCQSVHDAAVTSFRVLDAPAAYIRRHIDSSEEPQAATTTSVASNATIPPRTTPQTTTPQYATSSPPPTTNERSVTAEKHASTPPVSTSQTVRENALSNPKASPTPQTASQTQFPYGKPVPGKPGYVYSPFDRNGGYVDVTGYSPGSKVKDPYTGKIFLVP
jgi:hypothetical protein